MSAVSKELEPVRMTFSQNEGGLLFRPIPRSIPNVADSSGGQSWTSDNHLAGDLIKFFPKQPVFTPAFRAPSQKVLSPRVFRDYQLRYVSALAKPDDKKNQILLPRPSKNHCQVCKKIYGDYLQHTTNRTHLKKTKKQAKKFDISQLIMSFNFFERNRAKNKSLVENKVQSQKEMNTGSSWPKRSVRESTDDDEVGEVVSKVRVQELDELKLSSQNGGCQYFPIRIPIEKLSGNRKIVSDDQLTGQRGCGMDIQMPQSLAQSEKFIE